MANIGKWNTPSAVATVMSTELNALASGTQVTASSAYANQTNLDIFVDIEVFLTALSPATGAYVALYLLEAIDGTNYPTPSAADLRLTTTQLLVAIPVGVTSSTAQRVVARNVVIPPGTFKPVLDNQVGTALAGTLNTIKFLPYDYNLNG